MRRWRLVPGLLIGAAAASAHVNDRGMDYRPFKDRYGSSCCSEHDCMPAADFLETEVRGQPVVKLLINGVWITVPQSYVIGAHASDGRAHFCGNLHLPNNNPRRGETGARLRHPSGSADVMRVQSQHLQRSSPYG
jgi:hypothetical protein